MKIQNNIFLKNSCQNFVISAPSRPIDLKIYKLLFVVYTGKLIPKPIDYLGGYRKTSFSLYFYPRLRENTSISYTVKKTIELEIDFVIFSSDIFISSEDRTQLFIEGVKIKNKIKI